MLLSLSGMLVITFLRYLYTAWAAIVFVALLLITAPFFFLFSWIFGKHALPWVLFLCRFISWSMSVLLFIPMRLHRNKNIDRSAAYVIVANHKSNYDAPVAAASTMGNVRFLIKNELLKVPLLGSLFKRTAVSVDRSSPESRRRSMEVLAAYLAQGDSIFLFPEGTRNKTRDQVLIPFKDGAFRLAIELQVPVLPMVYINTQTVMPNKPLIMRPGTIHIYELDPIPTIGLQLEDVATLREQVRSVMQQAYIQYNGK